MSSHSRSETSNLQSFVLYVAYWTDALKKLEAGCDLSCHSPVEKAVIVLTALQAGVP